MNRRSDIGLGRVPALVGAFCILALAGGRAAEPQGVKLDEVPVAVRTTLERERGGGRIIKVEKQRGSEGMRYAAGLLLGGLTYRLEVKPNGTLLVKKLAPRTGAAREVALDRVPAAVRTTLERECGDGTIVKIETRTERCWALYRARVVQGGRQYVVETAADGTLLLKKLEAGQPGGPPGGRTWSFDRDTAGAVPAGWRPAETRGEGKLATWRVIRDPSAPSPPQAVAIVENPNYGSTFNLLLASGTHYRDATITVRVKAIAGREDQGGGPVWRARDARNYYIARWNPLEKNFRVYFVKSGRRRQLGSARVDVDTSLWHTIEIDHVGTRIRASFDGRKLIEVVDATFPDAGLVGLWVKADGRTAFDDLRVHPK